MLKREHLVEMAIPERCTCFDQNRSSTNVCNSLKKIKDFTLLELFIRWHYGRNPGLVPPVCSAIGKCLLVCSPEGCPQIVSILITGDILGCVCMFGWVEGQDINYLLSPFNAKEKSFLSILLISN